MHYKNIKDGIRKIESHEDMMVQCDGNDPIRHTAAQFVSDVIHRAKEMASRQQFSVVEEDEEAEAAAEEEQRRTNRPPPLLTAPSFQGPTPEILIDLVGDRSPSPEEEVSNYQPPITFTKKRFKTSDSSDDDDGDDGDATADRTPSEKDQTSTPPSASDTTFQTQPPSSTISGAVEQKQEEESEDVVAERIALKSNARITENPLSASNEELRHFVKSYIKGLTEQAVLLAQERQQKSGPVTEEPKRLSKSGVHNTKSPQTGPWYTRFRQTLSRCLRVGCFCVSRTRPSTPPPSVDAR